jgi:uncharacterized membrane protein YfcA
MTFEYVLILLATGIVVGFFAGLLGIGGGFFMTPVQIAVYSAMGLSTDMAVKLAFGTTLLVILPTAISGAWLHTRKGAVYWKAAIVMGSFSLVGSFIGATIAAHIPGGALKVAFGVIALLASARMVTGALPSTEEAPRNNIWLWIACAFPIGIVTGILGIGGGVMVVPVLVMVLRFSMHRTIATSLGMMILTSLGGAIGYIVNGLGVTGLPPWSIGYINLPAWALLTVSSIPLAQVGATLAHKLPARQLRYIFAALLFYVGLRMVGVFEWLGWPL